MLALLTRSLEVVRKRGANIVGTWPREDDQRDVMSSSRTRIIGQQTSARKLWKAYAAADSPRHGAVVSEGTVETCARCDTCLPTCL